MTGGSQRLCMALALGALVCSAAAHAADSVPTGSPLVAPQEDRARAVQCLSTAIAYEAGREPIEGQQAVAEVILNRVRDPLFPKTICGVVFAGAARRTGCQFSFTCDGSLMRRLPDGILVNTRAVAEAALDGANPVRTPGATHYHASYVSPYWAPSLVRVTRIGAHIFYRLPFGAGLTQLARAVTPRGEPLVAALGAQTASTVKPSMATPPASPPAPFAPWGLPLAGAER